MLGVIQNRRSAVDVAEIIDFSDDNTFHNIRRAWQLVEMIKRHGIRRKYKMYARADTIVENPKLFESFREAGLEYLTVGLESISDEGLKEINKKTSVKVNEEAIRIMKRLGIYVDAHFIIYPRFDEEDFSRLFQYVDEKCLFRNTFAILTPVPGTELYAENINRLVIRDYDYFDFGHSIFPTHLGRKEFYKQFARIYRKSYSPSKILIDKVLLVRDNNKGVKIGTPYIDGVKIKAKVLSNIKGKKLRVFKYKKRKDYRRTIGTRPEYTRILVEKIEGGK